LNASASDQAQVGEVAMKEQDKGIVRRTFLRRITTGVGFAVGASNLPHEALAADEPADEKRKARYQANSPDVQSFYRVNRYPAQ
jgi:hypothetical protein